MKKALLTLGTLGAVVAPIGAVIACGGDDSGEDTVSAFEGVSAESIAGVAETESEMAANSSAKVDGTTITLKVRTIDKDMWTNVANKFNSHGKGHVEISNSTISGANLKAQFSAAAAAGSMADLNVVDMNVVSYAKQNDCWFEALDFDSIGKEENKATYDVFDGQKSYGADRYMSSHVRINSNAAGVSLATPLGYGTKSIYVNATMVSEKNNTIHAFAPRKVDKNGDTNARVGIDDVGEFPRIASEVLDASDASDKKIDKNIAYMQRFLQDAGNRNSILNTPEIKAAHAGWLGWGPGNTYQRIFSAAQSLMNDDAKANNVYSMAFKEGNTAFSLMASAPVDGMYDYENKVLTKKGFNENAIQNGGVNPDLARYLWQSYGGYMFEGFGIFTPFMTADKVNQLTNQDSGEAEPFMNKRTMFGFKEPWAANMANRGWSGNPMDATSNLAKQSTWSKPGVTYANGNAFKSGQIRVLGAPYADISVADSLALTRGLPTAKNIVAKRFIKYISNVAESEKIDFVANETTFTKKTIAESIAWNYVHSNLDVQAEQKKNIEGKQAGWFQIGQQNAAGKPSDVYPSAEHGVEGTVWKNTDQDFYIMFETKAWVEIMKHYGFKVATPEKWTFEQFKAVWDKVMQQYKANASIED